MVLYYLILTILLFSDFLCKANRSVIVNDVVFIVILIYQSIVEVDFSFNFFSFALENVAR